MSVEPLDTAAQELWFGRLAEAQGAIAPNEQERLLSAIVDGFLSEADRALIQSAAERLNAPLADPAEMLAHQAAPHGDPARYTGAKKGSLSAEEQRRYYLLLGLLLEPLTHLKIDSIREDERLGRNDIARLIVAQSLIVGRQSHEIYIPRRDTLGLFTRTAKLLAKLGILSHPLVASIFGHGHGEPLTGRPGPEDSGHGELVEPWTRLAFRQATEILLSELHRIDTAEKPHSGPMRETDILFRIEALFALAFALRELGESDQSEALFGRAEAEMQTVTKRDERRALEQTLSACREGDWNEALFLVLHSSGFNNQFIHEASALVLQGDLEAAVDSVRKINWRYHADRARGLARVVMIAHKMGLISGHAQEEAELRPQRAFTSVLDMSPDELDASLTAAFRGRGYVLQERIFRTGGDGFLTLVYKAQRLSDGQQVALRWAYDPEFKKQDGFKLMAKLSEDPFFPKELVKVFDVAHFGEGSYAVMEWVDAPDAELQLLATPPTSLSPLFGILRANLSIESYLNSRGLTHADITLYNTKAHERNPRIFDYEHTKRIAGPSNSKRTLLSAASIFIDYLFSADSSHQFFGERMTRVHVDLTSDEIAQILKDSPLYTSLPEDGREAVVSFVHNLVSSDGYDDALEALLALEELEARSLDRPGIVLRVGDWPEFITPEALKKALASRDGQFGVTRDPHLRSLGKQDARGAVSFRHKVGIHLGSLSAPPEKKEQWGRVMLFLEPDPELTDKWIAHIRMKLPEGLQNYTKELLASLVSYLADTKAITRVTVTDYFSRKLFLRWMDGFTLSEEDIAEAKRLNEQWQIGLPPESLAQGLTPASLSHLGRTTTMNPKLLEAARAALKPSVLTDRYLEPLTHNPGLILFLLLPRFQGSLDLTNPGQLATFLESARKVEAVIPAASRPHPLPHPLPSRERGIKSGPPHSIRARMEHVPPERRVWMIGSGGASRIGQMMQGVNRGEIFVGVTPSRSPAQTYERLTTSPGYQLPGATPVSIIKPDGEEEKYLQKTAGLVFLAVDAETIGDLETSGTFTVNHIRNLPKNSVITYACKDFDREMKVATERLKRMIRDAGREAQIHLVTIGGFVLDAELAELKPDHQPNIRPVVAGTRKEAVARVIHALTGVEVNIEDYYAWHQVTTPQGYTLDYGVGAELQRMVDHAGAWKNIGIFATGFKGGELAIAIANSVKPDLRRFGPLYNRARLHVSRQVGERVRQTVGVYWYRQLAEGIVTDNDLCSRVDPSALADLWTEVVKPALDAKSQDQAVDLEALRSGFRRLLKASYKQFGTRNNRIGILVAWALYLTREKVISHPSEAFFEEDWNGIWSLSGPKSIRNFIRAGKFDELSRDLKTLALELDEAPKGPPSGAGIAEMKISSGAPVELAGRWEETLSRLATRLHQEWKKQEKAGTLGQAVDWNDIRAGTLKARWARVARWLAPNGFDYEKALAALDLVLRERITCTGENFHQWQPAYQALGLLGLPTLEIDSVMPHATGPFFAHIKPVSQGWMRPRNIVVAAGETFVNIGSAEGNDAVFLAGENPRGTIVSLDWWPPASLRQIDLAEKQGLDPSRFQIVLVNWDQPLPLSDRSVNHIGIVGQAMGNFPPEQIVFFYRNLLRVLAPGGKLHLQFIHDRRARKEAGETGPYGRFDSKIFLAKSCELHLEAVREAAKQEELTIDESMALDGLIATVTVRRFVSSVEALRTYKNRMIAEYRRGARIAIVGVPSGEILFYPTDLKASGGLSELRAKKPGDQIFKFRLTMEPGTDEGTETVLVARPFTIKSPSPVGVEIARLPKLAEGDRRAFSQFGLTPADLLFLTSGISPDEQNEFLSQLARLSRLAVGQNLDKESLVVLAKTVDNGQTILHLKAVCLLCEIGALTDYLQKLGKPPRGDLDKACEVIRTRVRIIKQRITASLEQGTTPRPQDFTVISTCLASAGDEKTTRLLLGDELFGELSGLNEKLKGSTAIASPPEDPSAVIARDEGPKQSHERLGTGSATPRGATGDRHVADAPRDDSRETGLIADITLTDTLGENPPHAEIFGRHIGEAVAAYRRGATFAILYMKSRRLYFIDPERLTEPQADAIRSANRGAHPVYFLLDYEERNPARFDVRFTIAQKFPGEKRPERVLELELPLMSNDTRETLVTAGLNGLDLFSILGAQWKLSHMTVHLRALVSLLQTGFLATASNRAILLRTSRFVEARQVTSWLTLLELAHRLGVTNEFMGATEQTPFGQRVKQGAQSLQARVLGLTQSFRPEATLSLTLSPQGRGDMRDLLKVALRAAYDPNIGTELLATEDRTALLGMWVENPAAAMIIDAAMSGSALYEIARAIDPFYEAEGWTDLKALAETALGDLSLVAAPKEQFLEAVKLVPQRRQQLEMNRITGELEKKGFTKRQLDFLLDDITEVGQRLKMATALLELAETDFLMILGRLGEESAQRRLTKMLRHMAPDERIKTIRLMIPLSLGGFGGNAIDTIRHLPREQVIPKLAAELESVADRLKQGAEKEPNVQIAQIARRMVPAVRDSKPLGMLIDAGLVAMGFSGNAKDLAQNLLFRIFQNPDQKAPQLAILRTAREKGILPEVLAQARGFLSVRDSNSPLPPLNLRGASRETWAGGPKANCALFPDARSATELAEGELQVLEQTLWQETLDAIAEKTGYSADILKSRWARIAKWLAPGGFNYGRAIQRVNDLLAGKAPQSIEEEGWDSPYKILALFEIDDATIEGLRPASRGYDVSYGYRYVDANPDSWREAGISLGEREVLVDIGSGDGQKGAAIAEANPLGTVIAFDAWIPSALVQIGHAERRSLSPKNFQVAMGDMRSPLPFRPHSIQHVSLFGGVTVGLSPEDRIRVYRNILMILGVGGHLYLQMNEGLIGPDLEAITEAARLEQVAFEKSEPSGLTYTFTFVPFLGGGAGTDPSAGKLPRIDEGTARTLRRRGFSDDELITLVSRVPENKRRVVLVKLAGIVSWGFFEQVRGEVDCKKILLDLAASVDGEKVLPLFRAIDMITKLRGASEYLEEIEQTPDEPLLPATIRSLRERVWIFTKTLMEATTDHQRITGRQQLIAALKVGYDDYSLRVLVWTLLEQWKLDQPVTGSILWRVIDMVSSVLRWDSKERMTTKIGHHWEASEWPNALRITREILDSLSRPSGPWLKRFDEIHEKMRWEGTVEKLDQHGFDRGQINRLFRDTPPHAEIHTASLIVKILDAGFLEQASADPVEAKSTLVALLETVERVSRNRVGKSLHALAVGRLVSAETVQRILETPPEQREGIIGKILSDEAQRYLEKATRSAIAVGSDEDLSLRRFALTIKDPETVETLLNAWFLVKKEDPESDPTVRLTRQFLIHLIIDKGPKRRIVDLLREAGAESPKILARVNEFFENLGEGATVSTRKAVLAKALKLLEGDPAEKTLQLGQFRLVPRGRIMVTRITEGGTERDMTVEEKRRVIDFDMQRIAERARQRTEQMAVAGSGDSSPVAVTGTIVLSGDGGDESGSGKWKAQSDSPLIDGALALAQERVEGRGLRVEGDARLSLRGRNDRSNPVDSSGLLHSARNDVQRALIFSAHARGLTKVAVLLGRLDETQLKKLIAASARFRPGDRTLSRAERLFASVATAIGAKDELTRILPDTNTNRGRGVGPTPLVTIPASVPATTLLQVLR